MPGMDDLASILTPSRGAPPYAQGLIKSWDPDTFENVVLVHGRDLQNLPVKSSVEALTYQAGDTVILARWPGSREGTSSWWIDGRAVIPGTGRGEEAIAFMTTALGSAVARAVIGNSVFYDFVEELGFRESFDTFGDLDAVAGDGPEVSFQLTGTKFIAVWGAWVHTSISTPASEVDASGSMSLDIVGPTAVAPDATNAVKNAMSFPSLDDDQLRYDASLAFSRQFTSMSPGDYTVTAKYAIEDHGSSLSSHVLWGTRWVLIIAF